MSVAPRRQDTPAGNPLVLHVGREEHGTALSRARSNCSHRGKTAPNDQDFFVCLATPGPSGNPSCPALSTMLTPSPPLPRARVPTRTIIMSPGGRVESVDDTGRCGGRGGERDGEAPHVADIAARSGARRSQPELSCAPLAASAPCNIISCTRCTGSGAVQHDGTEQETSSCSGSGPNRM